MRAQNVPGAAEGRRLAIRHKDKFEKLAKLGWATKGALYVTLGVLALMVAFGEGGQLSGGQGLIAWLRGQPFGTPLLVLATVGFTCYALWRAVQTIFDPESHDSKKEMIAKRLGWGLSGALHASLAYAAYQGLSGGGQGQNKNRMWLGELMQDSFGMVVVVLLGLFAIGVGLYQFKKAAKLGFLDDVDTGKMSGPEHSALKTVGRVGHAARGVVFPIIGYYLIRAAMSANPNQAKGVGGVLRELAQSGAIALALVAFGLAAYGVLQLFFARYRRIHI